MRKLITNSMTMFLLAGALLAGGAVATVSFNIDKAPLISKLSHVSLQQKTAQMLFAANLTDVNAYAGLPLPLTISDSKVGQEVYIA